MSTQTPRFTPMGCSPCAPLPHQHPVISGRGSPWKCPPSCSLCPECPFPSLPASGHLFIYLFIYLSYLLVFIDNWKSGWGGGRSLLLHSGGSWVSPTPSPCLWGAAGVPRPPSPFGEAGGEHTVPAGRAPAAAPSLQKLGALPALPIPVY